MAKWDVDTKIVNGCGQFVIDKNGTRLWSIRNLGIYFSDDNANSWAKWVDLPYHSIPFDVLFQDSNSNLYYAGCTTYDPSSQYPYYTDVPKIYRIDATTRSIEAVVTSTQTGMTFYQWQFTEDLDGYLYFGEYTNTGANTAYVWKSTPGGLNFQRVDIFYTLTDKHIHNIQCNPFNGKLYITIGDGPKRFFVSADKLNSITEIGENATGYTGLTFTSEAIYMSDDQSAGNNSVWRCVNNGPPENILTIPDTYNEQTYSLRACGDNELYLACVNENDIPDKKNAVLQLIKEQGINSPWSCLQIYEGSGLPFDVGMIGCQNHSIIPVNAPYLFVWSWYHGENNIRIQRVTDDELIVST